MNIVGIIAEYNPFHNGHKYQIEYAKNVLKADGIIIAMSGDFTQRGLPAVCSKESRANAAIESGADCVVEMPVCVYTADTVMFAQGAVDILYSLGCNSIVFGSESNDIKLLDSIAEKMITPKYEELYYSNMENGIKPPQAREETLKELMNFDDCSFINNPNNLLGIYYLCAAKRRSYNIEFFTHKRIGQSYFSEDLQNCEGFASATAIRKAISYCDDFENTIKNYVPQPMLNSLSEEKDSLLFIEDFAELIVEKILNCSKSSFENICLVPPMEYVPFREVSETARKTLSYFEIRKTFLQYVTPLRADRMIGWILLNQKRLSLEEYLQQEHCFFRVLKSNGRLNIVEIPATAEIINDWNAVSELCKKVAKNKNH